MDMNLLSTLAADSDSKMVLLVIDGLGGLPHPDTGLTELETARTPNLDSLAGDSVCGLIGSAPVSAFTSSALNNQPVSLVCGNDFASFCEGPLLLWSSGAGTRRGSTEVENRYRNRTVHNIEYLFASGQKDQGTSFGEDSTR